MKAVRVNGSILQCWRSSFSRSSFFCRRAIVGEPPGTDASKPCWPEGRQRWTSPHFAETLIAFFVGQTASFRPPSAPAVWKRRSCQWQSSSGVEQRTHKPLVGGSNPPSATKDFFHQLACPATPVATTLVQRRCPILLSTSTCIRNIPRLME